MGPTGVKTNRSVRTGSVGVSAGRLVCTPSVNSLVTQWRADSSLGPGPTKRVPVLRHTYVTTMLDAGVDLRDVQIAARHADPRTTMRYDRARKNLDRHPNYILAAYMASGT